MFSTFVSRKTVSKFRFEMKWERRRQSTREYIITYFDAPFRWWRMLHPALICSREVNWSRQITVAGRGGPWLKFDHGPSTLFPVSPWHPQFLLYAPTFPHSQRVLHRGGRYTSRWWTRWQREYGAIQPKCYAYYRAFLLVVEAGWRGITIVHDDDILQFEIEYPVHLHLTSVICSEFYIYLSIFY